jgi:Lrp/AsnC family transcriptional regulator, regulator for asnA, asnC and gidA
MASEIDRLDLNILEYLQVDSRRPYLEIARNLNVSGGTVHARINKMKELGIIQGSKIIIDYEKLGFSIFSFVGVRLAKAGSAKEVQAGLKAIPEIVEIHYTTGSYSLLLKVVARSMADLYRLLSESLQRIEDIQSTETFVVLHSPSVREPSLKIAAES